MRVPIRLGSAIAVAGAGLAAAPSITGASQGSLSYDPGHSLRYVVSAGNDTLSVFAANGDRLALA